MRSLWFSFFFFIITLPLQAQDKQICFQTEYGLECERVADVSDSFRLIRDQLELRRNQNYFAVNIDSSFHAEDSIVYQLFLGPKFTRLNFNSHNVPTSFLDSSEGSLSQKDFKKLTEDVIGHFENNGYPFASFYLQNTYVSSDSLFCDLFFDRGVEMRYDSIIVVGTSDLSSNYLANYLNTPLAELYEERNVKKIDQQLRNLPLVNVKRNSRIQFHEGLARIIVYLDDRVTDRLDGVVGLAPNSNNTDDASLLFTGELHLELNNLFRSAKQLGIHWRNYLERSQEFDASIAWPYLFDSKLGINASFRLNKFDSLFLNVESQIGLRYQQQGNNYFQFYYKNLSSSLLSVDTSSVRAKGKIPSDNPYSIDNYGLSFYQRDLNYLPNPRKGYVFGADVSVGLRNLKRNALIEQVRFQLPGQSEEISVYDTLDLRSARAKLEIHTQLFIPVGKYGSIVNELRLQSIFASDILRNEFFILGGYRSLQGFDENSIFASKYLLYRLEYRYLFDQNSNVGVFVNLAAVEHQINDQWDIPYGFGVSANVEVGGGIMRLAYALGSQQGNPIEFSTGKIHFGLVNYF